MCLTKYHHKLLSFLNHLMYEAFMKQVGECLIYIIGLTCIKRGMKCASTPLLVYIVKHKLNAFAKCCIFLVNR